MRRLFLVTAIVTLVVPLYVQADTPPLTPPWESVLVAQLGAGAGDGAGSVLDADAIPPANAATISDNLPQSSAFWTAFLTIVALPFLGKFFALLADLLFTWARAKGVKGAAAWERAWRIAESAIGYVDAATAAARKEALSDGKIDAAEAKRLQGLALAAVKQWLGAGGLEQLAKEAGIHASAAEEWIRGVIEARFNVKKIAEAAAQPSLSMNVPAPLQATPEQIEAATGLASPR